MVFVGSKFKKFVNSRSSLLTSEPEASLFSSSTRSSRIRTSNNSTRRSKPADDESDSSEDISPKQRRSSVSNRNNRTTRGEPGGSRSKALSSDEGQFQMETTEHLQMEMFEIPEAFDDDLGNYKINSIVRI